MNRPTGKQIGGGITAAVAAILIAVFANEGGYVNDPADPGGATNHGITERVARRHGYTGNMRDFQKHCVAPDDICADSIYRKDYIERPGFLPIVAISPAIGEEVIDSAVNFGPPRPSRWLQRSINEICNTRLAVDGRVGPMTAKALADCMENTDAQRTCVRMLDSMDRMQRAEYDRLVRVNPRLRRFYRGWINHRIGNVDRSKCNVEIAA